MIFVIILQPYEKLTGNDIRHLELEIGSKNNCHNAAMQKKKKKKHSAPEALSGERHSDDVLCLRSDHCGRGSAVIGTDRLCITKIEWSKRLDKIREFSVIIMTLLLTFTFIL